MFILLILDSSVYFTYSYIDDTYPFIKEMWPVYLTTSYAFTRKRKYYTGQSQTNTRYNFGLFSLSCNDEQYE